MRSPHTFFMTSIFHSYLRKRRRQYGLSQDDIAAILGVHSRSHVSMLESGDRRPSAEQIYLLDLLFGEGQNQLFPGLFTGARHELARRLRLLLQADDPARSGNAGRRKLLEDALGRIEGGGNNQGES